MLPFGILNIECVAPIGENVCDVMGQAIREKLGGAGRGCLGLFYQNVIEADGRVFDRVKASD